MTGEQQLTVGVLLLVAFGVHCVHDYAKTRFLLTGKRLFPLRDREDQDEADTLRRFK